MLFSHTRGYIADDFIIHSQPKTKRSYLPVAWFMRARFFSPFFQFLIVTAPPWYNIFSSVRAIRYLAYGAITLFLLFYLSFRPELLQSKSAAAFYSRAISPRLLMMRFYVRENGDLSGESAHFHNAAFPSTSRVSIILSRIITAVARSNYSSRPSSGIRDSLRIPNVEE